MCGRFVSHTPPDVMRVVFGTAGPAPNHGVNWAANWAANWNVAPTQDAMVVRRHPGTGERHLNLLRWGLVPSWSPGPGSGRPAPINARCETAGSSGMFRQALASRRCIVPADAYYEWRAEPGGKQPFAVARADGAPMAFAGLWEGWRSPEGEVVRTFCTLTCAANATMRFLHARMSVILEPDAWPVWLGDDAAAARELMVPAAANVLRFWPVCRGR